MDRHVLISADCHVGPLPSQAREYISSSYLPKFDDWLANTKAKDQRKADHTGQAIYGDEALEDFDAENAVADGGMRGAWESQRRIEELNADGIVAEVLFPGGGGETIGPFDAGLMTYQYEQSPELWLEGCRSYNRWLADFCAEVPGRRAGVTLITVDDIDITVKEITESYNRGLTGGIVLPVSTNGHPYYNHPRYEPLWALCAELNIPIHTHSGWTPNYGDIDGSLGIFLFEITWYAHRPLQFLIWSGVFERHPSLKFVMTEQGASWVIKALQDMDNHYQLPMFKHLRRALPKLPSEYFKSNCFIGAAFLHEDADAASERYNIGVDKLMWGSDYPHIEGTWPHTAQVLQSAFSGVPRAETRKMLGENAAQVYNFDYAKLSAIAAEIGPKLEAIGST